MGLIKQAIEVTETTEEKFEILRRKGEAGSMEMEKCRRRVFGRVFGVAP